MKKKLQEPVKSLGVNDSPETLRIALKKRKKEELIDALLELARQSRETQRELETKFGVEPSNKLLVPETLQAIIDATDFDEREMNYNFAYDYQAYETVKRNFGRMVNEGQLEQAMKLSLELMSRGSYQVEMSDEGMMTDEIQECLQVVIRAVKDSAIPASDVLEWCDALTKSDRVGFILDREINTLRKRLEESKK